MSIASSELPTATRAAVLRAVDAQRPYASSKPLQIETLSLDPPGLGEVMVKVAAAGLCHSDLSVINGSRPRPLPMALGHEAAGIVLAVGDDVKDFVPGDHVVLAFVPSCGECRYCLSERSHLCEAGAKSNGEGTLIGGHRRLADSEGQAVNHHLGISAFSEHIVVSAKSAIKIPKELPLPVAAVFGCAVLTGFGAAKNAAECSSDTSAAIFGLGGVGLAALLGAVNADSRPIVVVDAVEQKLQLALELGATHAINVTEVDSVVDEIRKLVPGGVDRAIETVGNEKVLEQAYQATARGGVTVTVGLPDPSAELTLSPVALVAEEKTIKGSYLGSVSPTSALPEYLSLHSQGRLPVETLISETIALDQINEGFDKLADGAAIRQIIVFN